MLNDIWNIKPYHTCHKPKQQKLQFFVITDNFDKINFN